MNEDVEAFARLLYRGNAAPLADLRAALADWVPFYRRHGEAIGVDVDYLVEEFWADGVDPWGVLIDVGILHKWVFEADWREFPDDIVAGLQNLVPAGPLPVGWDQLVEDEAEPEAVFAAVASQARPAGETLVVLDKGSDSDPLAFLPSGSVAEAQRLAGSIGEGRVVVAGEDAS